MAVLEWFATCVETQPGIIEVLLNIHAVHDTTSGQQVADIYIPSVRHLLQFSRSFLVIVRVIVIPLWLLIAIHAGFPVVST